MVFSSPIFLFAFLPLVLALYYAVPRLLKNSILLIFSLLFYAWGESFYVAIMLASIAANYAFGLMLTRVGNNGWKPWTIALAAVFNLGLIAYFKYFNFGIDNLNVVAGWIGAQPVEADPVHLPIGISFFTFQAFSYVLDVSRGDAEVQRNPFHLGLYISLFPQLIAGPIVRYQDVADQIIHRQERFALFASGVRRFAIGLGKKVLIANVVAWPADVIYGLPNEQVTLHLAWLGTLCYFFQIYFDFSGYSDMGIGLGRMFGFEFRENFNHPYIARSITDFWRRWHISLSTWFRDYLYIPLGGNRVRPWRVYANLCIVFLLCGLWHGATWNFVVWGAFHGLLLVMERVLAKRAPVQVPPILGHLYVILMVMVGWVLFRAADLSHALVMLKAMVGLGPVADGVVTAAYFLNNEVKLVLAAAMFCSVPVVPWLRALVLASSESGESPAKPLLAAAYRVGAFAGAFVLLIASFIQLSAQTHNPFIYFRF